MNLLSVRRASAAIISAALKHRRHSFPSKQARSKEECSTADLNDELRRIRVVRALEWVEDEVHSISHIDGDDGRKGRGLSLTCRREEFESLLPFYKDVASGAVEGAIVGVKRALNEESATFGAREAPYGMLFFT